MLVYIIRRVALLAPILFGITMISFMVTRAIPTDPVVAVLGQQAADHPDIVAAYRERWGLDKPVFTQYVVYLEHLLHGDLGMSLYTHRPVADDLLTYMPATVELATASVILSVLIALPLGTLAAITQGTITDLLVRLMTLIGVAMPLFWLALAAIDVFYLHLGIVPAPGRLDISLAPPPTITGMYTVDSLLTGRWQTFYSSVAHLMLPAAILATWACGTLTRMTRTSMLAVLPQGFLNTARSKGASEAYTILRHAAPNALIAVVTVTALIYGGLLTGVILIETLFDWPGIGHYAYAAATYADFPAIIGVTLLYGVVFSVLNLAVDIIYAILDPRIRSAIIFGRR